MVSSKEACALRRAWKMPLAVALAVLAGCASGGETTEETYGAMTIAGGGAPVVPNSNTPAANTPGANTPAAAPPGPVAPATGTPAPVAPTTGTPAPVNPASDPPAPVNPASDPPASDPPASDPSGSGDLPTFDPTQTPEPASDDPAAVDPPASDPDAVDPPTSDPGAVDPPASDPPASDPPASGGGGFDLGSIFGGGGADNSPAPTMSDGECCDDGNCICRAAPPAQLSARNGTYRVGTERATTGTLYYPMDAEPPFVGVAICPGFLNTGPEMRPWGQFYASHGIVTMVTNTGGGDLPDLRATKLLRAVDEMKRLAAASGGAIGGKMAGWYGTSGYSMGGGGTTIAASQTPSLKTSVGLAAWGPSSRNTKAATLLLCGSVDVVAPCEGMTGAFRQIADSVPKAFATMPLAGHLDWFSPTTAGGGLSGSLALAWQKVYLEGDTRWKDVLVKTIPNGSQTNLK